jgi:hypothetical protein
LALIEEEEEEEEEVRKAITKTAMSVSVAFAVPGFNLLGLGAVQ